MLTSKLPQPTRKAKPSMKNATNLPGVHRDAVNRKVRSHPNQQAARRELSPKMDPAPMSKKMYEVETYRSARKHLSGS